MIPRQGDIWEIIIPKEKTKNKKRKRFVKEVDYVSMDWYERKDGSLVKHPTVHWKRLPKGRYSFMRGKWVMKYGTRLSTKAERDAEFEARVEQRRAERKLKA